MELIIIVIAVVVIYQLFIKKDNTDSGYSQVRSYKRRNGTRVRSHQRRKSKR